MVRLILAIGILAAALAVQTGCQQAQATTAPKDPHFNPMATPEAQAAMSAESAKYHMKVGP